MAGLFTLFIIAVTISTMLGGYQESDEHLLY